MVQDPMPIVQFVIVSTAIEYAVHWQLNLCHHVSAICWAGLFSGAKDIQSVIIFPWYVAISCIYNDNKLFVYAISFKGNINWTVNLISCLGC